MVGEEGFDAAGLPDPDPQIMHAIDAKKALYFYRAFLESGR